jgi:hypothetical protein
MNHLSVLATRFVKIHIWAKSNWKMLEHLVGTCQGFNLIICFIVPYELLDSLLQYKIIIPKISKNNLLNSYLPPLSLSVLSLFHISFIHPFHLHSVFLPVPSPPSLSFSYIHSTWVRLCLSPHGTFCTFFLLLLSSICFLSPRSHIWISSTFFFLLHFLSPGTPEFPLSYTSHTPCCIWIL